MNLWNKKVYDILFRLCGCKCGHGYLKHEEEIILPPPKQLQLKKTSTKAQLKPELKDVKLKKAKNTPTLKFNPFKLLSIKLELPKITKYYPKLSDTP